MPVVLVGLAVLCCVAGLGNLVIAYNRSNRFNAWAGLSALAVGVVILLSQLQI